MEQLLAKGDDPEALKEIEKRKANKAKRDAKKLLEMESTSPPMGKPKPAKEKSLISNRYR